MADFLLEIGCEEIPARMLDAGAAELAKRVGDLLVRERLAQSPAAESYATPRRLAVLARGIAAAQADVEEQVLGPSLKVAYKDGKPTPAAEAFARKVGLGMDKLKNVTTPKGEYLAADVVKRGRSASELLAELLPKEIAGIYWPKNMYWRAGKPERFVRPVRWLVAMLDGEVVPVEFGGIRAGEDSRGHRILSSSAVKIGSSAAYREALERASVLADRAAREQRIRKALDAAARAVPGARWREDADLLDTVVNLTEWPSAILGSFDREFLALPEEVLVTVMRDHQKYFAVEDADGRLAPHFLAVLNTDGDPSGVIRHGNERVLRARFNDARFFWDTDQKLSLRDRVESLKHVTFQKDLGSYYDKTMRVQHLASQLCQVLKDAGVAIRPGIVHKAALLAKTDLTTELVKEFTELQGIVGGLYARVQQLDPSLTDELRDAIATAIYDQYKPESTEDAVPRTIEGAVLSIADKADSIAGMFALGLVPSGSKDPFALRRQANGIVKILGEKKLRINPPELFTMAYRGYAGTPAAEKFTVTSLDRIRAEGEFLRERLQFYLRDVLGFSYDVVNAVLQNAALTVPPLVERAQAVAKVRGTEDFEAISIAFKRIKNILRQAQDEHKAIAEGHILSADKMHTDAERELAKVVFERGPEIRQLSIEGRYDDALRVIAGTRPIIDKFFDHVMVMVDDESVRSMRLGLLHALYSSFSTIADFSEIVTEKPKA